MKNTLLIGLALLMGFTACAQTQDDKDAVEENHRSLVFDTSDQAPPKTFYDKCVLGGKCAGGTAAGLLFSGCLYAGAKTKGLPCLLSKESTVVDKASVLCMACVALFISAKSFGYSYENLKEALSS